MNQNEKIGGMETIPKIGDYVTANLAEKTINDEFPNGINAPRQGVYIKDNGNGTVVLKGELGEMVCIGPNDMVVVPDNNLKFFESTVEFIKEERKKLGL